MHKRRLVTLSCFLLQLCLPAALEGHHSQSKEHEESKTPGKPSGAPENKRHLVAATDISTLFFRRCIFLGYKNDVYVNRHKSLESLRSLQELFLEAIYQSSGSILWRQILGRISIAR